MAVAATKYDDLEQWVPRELFAAYCGQAEGKPLAYYDKARAKRQIVRFHFDALALLLFPVWLGYRRQWTLWVTLIGVLLGFALLERLTGIELPDGAFAGSLGALGLMAHGLLLMNANGLFHKLKRQGLAHDAIARAMADRAKPSLGHACAALLGTLAVGAVLAWLSP